MRSRLPAALASVAGFACTTFTFYLIANYDGASLYADDRGAAGNWFRSRRPGQALGTDPIASLALANPSEYAVKCSASTTAERVVELYASRWDVVNVLLFPTSPKLAADAAPLAALCGAPAALNQFGGDPVVRCPSQWFSAAYGCVDTPRPSSGPLWRRLELPPAERTTRVTTTTMPAVSADEAAAARTVKYHADAGHDSDTLRPCDVAVYGVPSDDGEVQWMADHLRVQSTETLHAIVLIGSRASVCGAAAQER
jgi:hypothetical protein